MLIINLKDNLEFRWQVCINALETWNFVVSIIGLGTSFAGTNEHGPLLVRIYSTTSFDLCWQVLIARFIKPLKAIYKVLLYKTILHRVHVEIYIFLGHSESMYVRTYLKCRKKKISSENQFILNSNVSHNYITLIIVKKINPQQ